MEKFASPRILFLAQYAPAHKEDAQPPVHSSDGVFPRYHYEIFQKLCSLGLRVMPSRSIEDLLARRTEYDYVFSLMNRGQFKDSEVLVSALAEYLAKPYLGARPRIRALAQDKHLTKRLAQVLAIPTPNWMPVSETSQATVRKPFSGPYHVKPRSQAASVGVGPASICYSWGEAREYSSHLASEWGDVLIEEFIPGSNVTLPILGTRHGPAPLPLVETTSDSPGGTEYYEQKRMLFGGIEREIYSGPAAPSITEASVRYFNEIAPVDYVRFDFRVTSTGKPYLLEFNICCSLGSHSMIAIAAASQGISQSELLMGILAFSFGRQNLSWQPL